MYIKTKSRKISMNSTVENNLQYLHIVMDLRNDNTILSYVLSCTSLTFCLLALVILCYFARRRFLLTRDIKEISKDDLINPCYQNHLKNLKIKSMIANFIIVIVIFEIIYNFSNLIFFFPIQNTEFLKIDPVFVKYLFLAKRFFNYVRYISSECHITIPCLLLKVLLLTYHHRLYKNTVIRWSGCIAVRCAVSITMSFSYRTTSPTEVKSLAALVWAVLYSSDLVLYIFYARIFYKHLKSRETEARLFKDRTSYRSERCIRIHFKVASIIIALGISFYVIPFIVVPFFYLLNQFITKDEYSIQVCNLVTTLAFILYTTVMASNYLYLVTKIVGSYLIQKWKLNRINRKIKPIVAKYHEGLLYRRY